MKKILLLCLALALIGCANFSSRTWALHNGCVPMTSVKPPTGIIYTHYKAPLTTEFDSTPVGYRIGEGQTQYLRDIFITTLDVAWGKNDIRNALEDRGMKPSYSDYEYLTVFLGLYANFRIHTYGQN